MARAVFFVVSCFLLALACRREAPPAPSPPPAVAQPAPAPAPPPPVDSPPARAVEEAPLTPCQRKCSISANHKQLQGFLRCEKAGGDLDACKAKVLTDTDAGRAACRQRCQAGGRTRK